MGFLLLSELAPTPKILDRQGGHSLTDHPRSFPGPHEHGRFRDISGVSVRSGLMMSRRQSAGLADTPGPTRRPRRKYEMSGGTRSKLSAGRIRRPLKAAESSPPSSGYSLRATPP